MAVSYSLRDLEPGLFERVKSFPSSTDAFAECNASLEEPRKIGQYSLSNDKETGLRKTIFNDSKLTYLHLPSKLRPFAFDLSEGYEKYRHINWCSAPNVKLDEFLEWIVENKCKFALDEPKPLVADFVTYRGVLTKLMVTANPFVRDKWLIGATKFKGTIYLCPYYEEENLNENGNLFSYGGLRFENYLTRSAPNKVACEPFSSVKDEYSVVMKSKVQSSSGKISLLYAAEVDCLDVDKTNPDVMQNFVEIKTTREMRHENQYRNFRKFKLIKWWAQSYLIGVPKIICGYKDDRHVVSRIEALNVHQIPQQCSAFWSRRQCLNFLSQFLAFVQQLVTEDNPNQVYLFSNDCPNMISTRKLFHSGHFQILPEWYIQAFDKKKL